MSNKVNIHVYQCHSANGKTTKFCDGITPISIINGFQICQPNSFASSLMLATDKDYLFSFVALIEVMNLTQSILSEKSR